MLENEAKLKDVNREELFAKMLEELPWAALRAFVQANSQLQKQVTAGGHRMNSKRRSRVHKVIAREAAKNDFSQTITNGLFAAWYPVHEDLHKTLEDYFHSDEYKEYREEHDLDEEDYVLSPEKFDEFFSIDQLEEWRVLLCFSPLKFTDEQADTILDDSQGNTRLLGIIKDLEEDLEQAKKRESQIRSEADRLREEHKEANAEAQEAKKANRGLRNEIEALNTKLERAQNENRKLRSTVKAAEQEQKAFEEKLNRKLKTEGARLQNEVDRLEKELSEWQSKYEEQRLQNKGLEEGIVAAKRESSRQEAKAVQASEAADQLKSFADLVLERIDWPKVGAAMKLTPKLRQQFNSLIRKLNYEEDRSLTIEGTLPEFWESMMDLERELIDSIARSNSQEVMSGDVENYWIALTDAFGDVQISLEARGVVLKMLQEIFYQVMEIDDLEEPVIPPVSVSQ